MVVFIVKGTNAHVHLYVCTCRWWTYTIDSKYKFDREEMIVMWNILTNIYVYV